MGKLYVVGTPIGNLGDFSKRGIETLKNVDFIAAEDTRVTRKLLNHFEISTPSTSYHQHNMKEKGERIVERILNGESCALVSDAGMPAISDPGEDLVRLCHNAQLEVEVIPGPTALTSALALCGLDTRKFVFEGFLEGKTNEKRQQLEEIKDLSRTVVYYEAPHKLLDSLKIMLEVLGDRRISVCREITKIHQEMLGLSISEAIVHFSHKAPKGEFVIVVEKKPKADIANEFTLEQAVEMLLARDAQGVSLSKASKEIAEITGYKKNELYKKALEVKGS